MEITGFCLSLDMKGTPDEDIEFLLADCDSMGVHTTLDEQRVNAEFSGDIDDLKKTLEIVNEMI